MNKIKKEEKKLLKAQKKERKKKEKEIRKNEKKRIMEERERAYNKEEKDRIHKKITAKYENASNEEVLLYQNEEIIELLDEISYQLTCLENISANGNC